MILGSGHGRPIVVLGLGNLIAGDDGLGIHALRELREVWAREPAMVDVAFVDGGLLGIDLLVEVERAGRLLVLDAVDVGGEPGSVAEISADALLASRPGRLSVHQVAFSDLLGLARLRGCAPSEVVILGVQPADVSAGDRLSAQVAEALPTVVERARRLLRAWTSCAGPPDDMVVAAARARPSCGGPPDIP